MTEKKYETVSEFLEDKLIEVRGKQDIGFTYHIMIDEDKPLNTEINEGILDYLDKQFINKDKLRFEINKNIKFWNNYLKICHIDLKEHTCGQVLAFKKILKLLEE